MRLGRLRYDSARNNTAQDLDNSQFDRSRFPRRDILEVVVDSGVVVANVVVFFSKRLGEYCCGLNYFRDVEFHEWDRPKSWDAHCRGSLWQESNRSKDVHFSTFQWTGSVKHRGGRCVWSARTCTRRPNLQQISCWNMGVFVLPGIRWLFVNGVLRFRLSICVQWKRMASHFQTQAQTVRVLEQVRCQIAARGSRENRSEGV